MWQFDGCRGRVPGTAGALSALPASRADAGTVVAIRGSIHFVFDASNGTFAFDGQVFMANRPGAGVVIQDTGKYLVGPDDQVLLDAGPHDVEDIGPSIFCSALL